MSTTSEKQATGFEMTSQCFDAGNGTWTAVVNQDGRDVFCTWGCSSQQHAEQIARDIMVRYALTERPTI